jgi:hypothetical protein
VSNPYARRAIAREADRGVAFKLLEEYSGSDGETLANADFALEAFRDEQAGLIEQERALQSVEVPPRDALLS